MLQFHAQSMSVKVVVKVGVKYLAARILEPGYGKKAGGLLYNVTLSHDLYVFSPAPCPNLSYTLSSWFYNFFGLTYPGINLQTPVMMREKHLPAWVGWSVAKAFN